MAKAGLLLRSPFGDLSPSVIADRVRPLTVKLHKDEKLRDVYSVEDLRHAFAVRLYREMKDINAVKTALAHANVTVT